ncbi:hypothetical protein ACROYT_G015294 [Oculina patagonica]
MLLCAKVLTSRGIAPSVSETPLQKSTIDGETSADILVSEEFNPPLDSSADLFDRSMEVAESFTTEQEQSMYGSANFPGTINQPSEAEPPAEDKGSASTSFSVPNMDEPSIVEPPATEDKPAAALQLDFQIVKDSTKRGKNKLVDNRGYTYNIERCCRDNSDWQCTVRPKVNP